MKNKTVFFKNCYGVFEGGGCRGAAYIGAYKAAVERGVNFSAVAGTSAGAIIAVLIGAGASVDQLEDISTRLDFNKFLAAPPESINGYKKPWFTPLVGWFNGKASKVISKLGIYSSIEIERFIAVEFQKLFNRSTPVTFKDLKIPTTIIATDLKTKKAKIWSSELTPDDEVAKAVRASCSIPFFFQPVENQFVDGGAISNLPSFVFSGINQKGPKKILAFSLESETGAAFDINTIGKYCTSLFVTLIDGAKELQLRLQKNVHMIRINTGTVSSVDFEKANAEAQYLITQGKNATNLFFDNEILNIKNSIQDDDVCKTYFQTYEVIAQTSDSRINEVVIIEHDTDWVYKLFPAVLSWFTNRAKVKVVLKTNSDDEKHGPYRQRLLKSMGAELVYQDAIPYRGFLFNPTEEENAMAIIRSERIKTNKMYDSVLYKGKPNVKIIELLHQLVPGGNQGEATYKPPVLVPVLEDPIIKMLAAGVSQYNKPGVKLEFVEIDVSSLYSLTKFVTGFKYLQVNKLYDIYSANSVREFKPCKLVYSDSRETYITPPVIENIGDKNVIIEGTTRITYAYHSGIKSVYVVLVSGVKDALPASTLFKISELQVTDEDVEADNRYEGFNYNNFRTIEKAVRNPKDCLLDK